MEQSHLLNTLGLDFKKATISEEYNLPPIETLTFHQKELDKLRSHLSRISSQELKAKRQIIKLLQNGRIEEIQREGNTYIFTIAFPYLGEKYAMNLLLDDTQFRHWHIHSIQYTGKQGSSRKWTYLAVAGVFLFAVLYSIESFGITNLLKDSPPVAAPEPAQPKEEPIEDKQEVQPEKAPASEQTQDASEEPITFEELQLLVQQFEEYALIRKDEFNQLAEMKTNYEKLQVEYEKEKQKPAQEVYIIRVSPGMRSDQIANTLYAVGLIDSPAKFQRMVKDRKLGYKLLKGTHRIPKGSSYDDILKILTTPS
ncbi:hypothetical protein [Niallia taxi]|uniref:hypothetical protein n=1 Tax=Niallia taxi TaxID=2499688 RepID=UPI0015F6B7D5|nr:hypothetical protein [Niallia taxi]